MYERIADENKRHLGMYTWTLDALHNAIINMVTDFKDSPI